ncbi:MAG: hypothetical protein DRJ47_04875 [Thermoprotei archaeon]|nr:MAG: hypothetical protein DRJ47_04875 [Thermoprotei archaeon]
MSEYDIVVVGAGTAGAYASALLAEKGFKVALIDMKAKGKIGDKVCGDAIGSHHFKNTGLEPPQIGSDADGIFKGVRVFSPNKRGYITAVGEGYALNRYAFGQRLLKKALNAGVELFDRHYALKPLIEESWVKGVRARNLKNGMIVDFKSKVVIDASGAVSTIRVKLPSEWWVSEKVSKRDLIAAYREVIEVDEDLDAEYADIFLDVDVAPGGYWWFFPKSKNIVNVGLGVQQGEKMPNPRMQYLKYVRPIIEKKGIRRIIHSGGGIVPTRRTIYCMVWNGFVAVGDAACTANPIHGGGIGPSLLSSLVASKTIEEAFEKDGPSIEKLWPYHHRYHSEYGVKQASLDVLRLYLQKLTNEDLDFIIGENIVNNEELTNLGYKGELQLSILTKLNLALRLMRRPTILRQVKVVKDYMDKVRSLFSSFPNTPREFPEWRLKIDALFNGFLEQMSKL